MKNLRKQSSYQKIMIITLVSIIIGLVSCQSGNSVEDDKHDLALLKVNRKLEGTINLEVDDIKLKIAHDQPFDHVDEFDLNIDEINHFKFYCYKDAIYNTRYLEEGSLAIESLQEVETFGVKKTYLGISPPSDVGTEDYCPNGCVALELSSICKDNMIVVIKLGIKIQKFKYLILHIQKKRGEYYLNTVKLDSMWW